MGSEQSSQSGGDGRSAGKNATKLKRGKSVPESSWPRGSSQDSGQHGGGSRAASANTSPGHSVCSDVDLPYVSYTVNRPIGGKSDRRRRVSVAPSTRTSGGCIHPPWGGRVSRLTGVAKNRNPLILSVRRRIGANV